MSDEQRPVAWGVCLSHDVLDCEFVYEHRDNAKQIADESNGSIIPLYRSPALTDAERAAIVQSADFADWDAEYFAADRNKSLADRATQRAATLRGLLERRGCCPDREQQARKEGATPARSGEAGDDSPDRE